MRYGQGKTWVAISRRKTNPPPKTPNVPQPIAEPPLVECFESFFRLLATMATPDVRIAETIIFPPRAPPVWYTNSSMDGVISLEGGSVDPHAVMDVFLGHKSKQNGGTSKRGDANDEPHHGNDNASGVSSNIAAVWWSERVDSTHNTLVTLDYFDEARLRSFVGSMAHTAHVGILQQVIPPCPLAERDEVHVVGDGSDALSNSNSSTTLNLPTAAALQCTWTPSGFSIMKRRSNHPIHDARRTPTQRGCIFPAIQVDAAAAVPAHVQRGGDVEEEDGVPHQPNDISVTQHLEAPHLFSQPERDSTRRSSVHTQAHGLLASLVTRLPEHFADLIANGVGGARTTSSVPSLRGTESVPTSPPPGYEQPASRSVVFNPKHSTRSVSVVSLSTSTSNVNQNFGIPLSSSYSANRAFGQNAVASSRANSVIGGSNSGAFGGLGDALQQVLNSGAMLPEKLTLLVQEVMGKLVVLGCVSIQLGEACRGSDMPALHGLHFDLLTSTPPPLNLSLPSAPSVTLAAPFLPSTARTAQSAPWVNVIVRESDKDKKTLPGGVDLPVRPETARVIRSTGALRIRNPNAAPKPPPVDLPWYDPQKARDLFEQQRSRRLLGSPEPRYRNDYGTIAGYENERSYLKIRALDRVRFDELQEKKQLRKVEERKLLQPGRASESIFENVFVCPNCGQQLDSRSEALATNYKHLIEYVQNERKRVRCEQRKFARLRLGRLSESALSNQNGKINTDAVVKTAVVQAPTDVQGAAEGEENGEGIAALAMSQASLVLPAQFGSQNVIAKQGDGEGVDGKMIEARIIGDSNTKHGHNEHDAHDEGVGVGVLVEDDRDQFRKLVNAEAKVMPPVLCRLSISLEELKKKTVWLERPIFLCRDCYTTFCGDATPLVAKGPTPGGRNKDLEAEAQQKAARVRAAVDEGEEEERYAKAHTFAFTELQHLHRDKYRARLRAEELDAALFAPKKAGGKKDSVGEAEVTAVAAPWKAAAVGDLRDTIFRAAAAPTPSTQQNSRTSTPAVDGRRHQRPFSARVGRVGGGASRRSGSRNRSRSRSASPSRSRSRSRTPQRGASARREYERSRSPQLAASSRNEARATQYPRPPSGPRSRSPRTQHSERGRGVASAATTPEGDDPRNIRAVRVGGVSEAAPLVPHPPTLPRANTSPYRTDDNDLVTIAQRAASHSVVLLSGPPSPFGHHGSPTPSPPPHPPRPNSSAFYDESLADSAAVLAAWGYTDTDLIQLSRGTNPPRPSTPPNGLM